MLVRLEFSKPLLCVIWIEQHLNFSVMVTILLTHWILDIFSATVSHGVSIFGTQRKFG